MIMSRQNRPAQGDPPERDAICGTFRADTEAKREGSHSTCLVCDLIQRHDPERITGFKGWLMRADGLVGPSGSTPREWRATFLSRRRARAAVRRALSWQPERLVVAHGEWDREGGTDALRKGLAWLKP